MTDLPLTHESRVNKNTNSHTESAGHRNKLLKKISNSVQNVNIITLLLAAMTRNNEPMIIKDQVQKWHNVTGRFRLFSED